MNYGISSGHEKTSYAAEEILRAGGNAFDAAIAALAAMCITEPCMSSLCGAGFAMMIPQGKKPTLLDFFCQTPQQKRSQSELKAIEVDFGDTSEFYYVGPGSIATPGTVAGIFEIHQRYATMPIEELFAPAMDLCRTGVIINDFQYYDFFLLRDILGMSSYGREHFFQAEQIKAVGKRIRLPELSDTLDYIGRQGVRSFYEGEIANLFFSQYENTTQLTKKDWKDYTCIYRKPLELSWAGKSVYTNPPPAVGGLWLIEYLKAATTDLNALDFLSEKHLRAQLEVWESLRAFRKNSEGLDLLSGYRTQQHQIRSKGTSHFSIIDKWSNAVSVTTTLGEGSGCFIEGTGLQLNNMLGEESILPNGIDSWIPDTRLASMCCPTYVSGQEDYQLVLGSGGGARIPFMIGQVLFNMLVLDQDIRNSVKAARSFDNLKTVQLEPGYPSLHHMDRQINLWENTSLYFGGVHGVAQIEGRLMAAADFRRDGNSILSTSKIPPN